MEHSKQATRNVLNGILLLLILALTFACTPQDTTTVKTDETAPQTQAQGPVAPSVPEEDTSPELDYSEYLGVSLAVGDDVDQYQGQEELLKTRSIVNTDQVDKCNSDKNINANNNFADQIAFYTEQMMASVPAKVGIIGSYYGAPSSDASYFPTSLISHPLCTSTIASLTSTIKKVPTQKVIDKLNRFALKVNTLRIEAMAGNSVSKIELMKTWTKLFSCMAYTESLGSADSTTSRNVASSNAPVGYSKPSGVEFYNDPSQDAASRLNIGLFQFTPNSSGNIKPCLKAWNAMHASSSSCQLNESGSQAEMIKALGSSYQSFNAFCGIHKVVQTFAIQVNTSSSSSTHPSNGGKAAANRCVTPHFYAGKAYNHFGPLQNSTGENMNSLYSCVEDS